MTVAELEGLVRLRKKLHKHPELSGQEYDTQKLLINILGKSQKVFDVKTLGETGILATYKFGDNGPQIMFRCELDALPIVEEMDLPHRSVNKGISHKCGHDGHMTILIGLAIWLDHQSFSDGQVHLLFQPAEETGKGAQSMLNDPAFEVEHLDYVFALHNIPGYHEGSIVLVEKQFTPAVESLSIHLKGKASHAADPGSGINPATAISELITTFDRLNVPNEKDENYCLLTPVYANMGQKAYGMSAGAGELHYTIRAWSEQRLEQLKTEIKSSISKIATEECLEADIRWFDHFPSVENDRVCMELIKTSARTNTQEIIIRDRPFTFGEDFGWFSKNFRSAMFGLGAGIDCPDLHHIEYDFPDEVILPGITAFSGILSKILNEQTS